MVELDVMLGAFVEDTNKKLDGIHKSVNHAAQRGLAIRKVIMGANTSAGPTTPLIIETTAQAPAGRIWNILSVGIFGSDGHTPVPFNTIPLAATGVASYNNNPSGVQLTIAGGTVTAIAINGTTTGLTSGTFAVPANGTVTVTYSVAPTTFTTAPNSVATPSGALIDLYIGASGLEEPDFSAQIDSGLDIPTIHYYPRLSNWCKYGEKVMGIAYNVPSGQQIVLFARVAEYELGDVEALRI